MISAQSESTLMTGRPNPRRLSGHWRIPIRATSHSVPANITPRSANGKLLLAHELTHVVQQAGARAAGGMVFRKVTKDDEAKKAKMVAHHKKQQQLVVDFLKKAQALTTDPKEPLAGDNLFRNTAELVNTGKANLFVLTPTHYSTSTSPMDFDVRVPHPQIDGDYPVDPTDPPVNTYSNETLNLVGLERPGLEAGGTTTNEGEGSSEARAHLHNPAQGRNQPWRTKGGSTAETKSTSRKRDNGSVVAQRHQTVHTGNAHFRRRFEEHLCP